MKKIVAFLLVLFISCGGLLTAEEAKKENPASDFVYDLTEDNIGVVIKRYKGKAKEVIIPSSIEDFPVVSVGKEAFAWNGNIVSVVIPDSVQEIGTGAFFLCTSLVSITIPDSVQEIGSSTFYDCTSLTSFTIGDNVQRIASSAFEKCTALVSVTIGKGIETIGSDAFRDCSSLKTFNIGVENLSYEYDYDVFSGCSALSLKEKKKIKDTGYRGSF